MGLRMDSQVNQRGKREPLEFSQRWQWWDVEFELEDLGYTRRGSKVREIERPVW